MNHSLSRRHLIETLAIAVGSFAILVLSQRTIEASNQETKNQPDAGQAPLTTNEDEPKSIPSLEDEVKDFEKQEGYLTFYWDERTGKIWLEVLLDDSELLFSHGISTGLGSNPVGLDRGQLGDQHVVRFNRVGNKLLMIERNLRFRASSDNPAEQRAVDESFAHSVLWGGEIAAEQVTENAHRVLVDATSLLLQDWHSISTRLKRTEQGEFAIDPNRSAVFQERCKAFPDNTELEATLTFSCKEPGPLVSQTTPSPQSVSIRAHYSFVRLPDGNYRPRVFDPRTPSIHITFSDYSSPIDGELEKRWITRHRLEKKNPQADFSEAVEPIVYYVDPGAPSEIQQALIEGASWWNEAFEAIGFKDAFQVKLLPDDADPMDVRFNTIQWVHRSTRGWSYGGSVIDPRTGEIIKGHVTLGSLRVRQDRLIFEGLQPRFDHQACSCCGIVGISGDTELASLDDNTSATEVALSRIRQLSAHEVGHTLGFVHNFAASTYGDRASVMDYPAPRITITDGKIDLSDAYGTGIGVWDKFAIEYAYRPFNGDLEEMAELKRIVEKSLAEGMLFMSDGDARPANAAHPLANLWDNGLDPIDELDHLMQVRKLALAQFGLSNVSAGTPMSEVEQTLVPIFLLHRYQIEATAKLIGGSYYTYAVAGDNQVPVTAVPVATQQKALNALLKTIEPANLEIDPNIVRLISPSRTGSLRTQEVFRSSTEPMFDPMLAAESVADMVFSQLLNHQRVARLANKDNYANRFGPQEMLFAMIDDIWSIELDLQSSNHHQISRIVKWRLNKHLLDLAGNADASIEVRAATLAALDRVHQYCKSHIRRTNRLERDFATWIKADIERFLNRPHQTDQPPRTQPAPAGSPIGQ